MSTKGKVLSGTLRKQTVVRSVTTEVLSIGGGMHEHRQVDPDGVVGKAQLSELQKVV